jgi:S1-C subfamily serine protease
VVRIDAVYPEGFGGGSGVVWEDEFHILTNAHVVEGAASIKVIDPVDGRAINARVLGISPCDDLALLEVDRGNFAPAPIGSSAELATGEDVVALGFPGTPSDPIGEELTITRGIVSKTGEAYGGLQDLIQTDTPINPGNSGGALVNMSGEVVGINTLKSTLLQDVNYAIAIDEAKFVSETLADGAKVNWIGARMEANVEGTAAYYGMVLDFEGQGVVVTGIDPNSPAEQGGLGWADIIYRVDNVDVYTFGEVCDIMRSKSPGDPIRFEFRRTYIDPETGEYSGYEDFYTDIALQ